MTRVEMMAESTGTLYVLEVNTLPGMTPTSLVPESAREAGMSFLDVVLRQLEAGLRRIPREALNTATKPAPGQEGRR